MTDYAAAIAMAPPNFVFAFGQILGTLAMISRKEIQEKITLMTAWIRAAKLETSEGDTSDEDQGWQATEIQDKPKMRRIAITWLQTCFLNSMDQGKLALTVSWIYKAMKPMMPSLARVMVLDRRVHRFTEFIEDARREFEDFQVGVEMHGAQLLRHYRLWIEAVQPVYFLGRFDSCLRDFETRAFGLGMSVLDEE